MTTPKSSKRLKNSNRYSMIRGVLVEIMEVIGGTVNTELKATSSEN